MGALTDQAAIVYRDFEIEGDAGSGAHKPIKDEIRALFEQTEAAISGGGGGTVMGPASAVASNIAIFSGTSGNVIQDGGKKISDLATAAALASGLAGKANVDHTHDQDDITNLVSDLAAKAPLASPHFTGVPTAPTAGVSDNSTQLATTGFVKAVLAGTVAFPSLTVNAGMLLLDRTGDAASANFRIAGDAGQQRDMGWRTGTLDRWVLRTGSGAESGANAGSDLSLIAFSDAGTSLGSALSVTRATRVLDFSQPPTISAAVLSAGDSSTKVPTTAFLARDYLAKTSARVAFVDDYDAHGGGADRDSLMIDAAISAQVAAGGGHVGMLPRIYSCTNLVELPRGVYINGSGPFGTKIQAAHALTSIVKTKDADGLYGVSDLGMSGVTLIANPANSAQLYGLLLRGCDHGEFSNIEVKGLTAITGAGWDATQRAWAFFTIDYVDGLGTRRKSSNNRFASLRSFDSPNGFCNAASDGATTGAGGNNNRMVDFWFTGFSGAGVDIFGESNSVIAPRINSSLNNIVCIRVRDAVTTIIAADTDSTNGTSIPSVPDLWGLPGGVRDNNNVGIYFHDTCSAVVVNPTGNGCKKRLDFQSTTALMGVQLLRSGYNMLAPLIGGTRRQIGLDKTANAIADMVDAGDIVRMNVATANTYTVPTNVAVPMPKGTEIEVQMFGVGPTTIVADVGVTIRVPDALTITTRYARRRLTKINTTDTWICTKEY